eukprot:273917-Chlamydomonas_euryale.AAC.6
MCSLCIQQVFELSIPGTVEALLSPEVPLALRLTGQLLLGVVRVFARKVAYLHQDCNDAIVKVGAANVATGRPYHGGICVRVCVWAGVCFGRERCLVLTSSRRQAVRIRQTAASIGEFVAPGWATVGPHLCLHASVSASGPPSQTA